MHDDVGQMIPDRIKPADMVVQGEGEISDDAGRVCIPSGATRKEVGKSLEDRIQRDVRFVVEYERGVESVQIREETCGNDQQNRQYMGAP